jgi:hypothetical protein
VSRQSTAKRPVFSASAVLEAAAADLAQIKHEDGLTWSDLGAVLGRSEDQAAKYAAAEAEMGLVAYARGKREWNGRFTGTLDRLCEETRPGTANDHTALTAVLQAAACLAKALEDGEIKPGEVRDHRPELERALAAIQDQLAKLRPAKGVS